MKFIDIIDYYKVCHWDICIPIECCGSADELDELCVFVCYSEAHQQRLFKHGEEL